jgi:signal transduction histidine kinase
VRPYFYYTWWFYMLVVLVLSAAAAGFYRYRIRQLKKELRLRSGIASDLHDDVGATLSSIKMLTTMLQPRVAGHEEATGIVNTIQTRAATTLEAMSDIVWSINPKNDAADNLVLRMKTYAAEILDDGELDYRLK